VPPSAASMLPVDAINLHSPESGNRNPPPSRKPPLHPKRKVL
jgi:hypothetical protein